MNYLLAIIAGAIQGLSEFLPISSTGHLIIFENVFKISQKDFGLAFDASLHLGTLLAIVTFFFKDYILTILTRRDMFFKIVIASIPGAVFGLLFEKIIETNIRQNWVVAVALIAFSLVIYWAEKVSLRLKKKETLSLAGALIVGLFQALALIPGVSRSGATISAGLFLGLTRQDAARFAFMISGPIIAGAGSKKFLEVITSGSINSQDASFFVVGIISSAIFGYLTIKYFLKFITTHSLTPFIIYRLLLAVALLAPYLLR